MDEIEKYEPYLKTSCEHFFVFEEKNINETCLRTNDISQCLNCSRKYEDIMDEIYSELGTLKSQEEIRLLDKRVPLFHCHIWRKDGTCGSKINFPDKNREDNKGLENYGFDDIIYCQMSNENRICTETRTS
jgi:hypothetical protein